MVTLPCVVSASFDAGVGRYGGTVVGGRGSATYVRYCGCQFLVGDDVVGVRASAGTVRG